MCTSIKIKSTSGDIFWGRTMDLDIPMFPGKPGFHLPTMVVTLPANKEIKSQLKNWTSNYNVLGVGVEGAPILFDGINEHGLAGDLQVLKECGWGELIDITNKQKEPLIAEELVSYMLTNYKTVSEIKDNINRFILVNQEYNYGGTTFHFPVHFSFVDESGEGIVLETTKDGTFIIFDHLNVMTNSPRYDYHEINIRNYISMSNVNIETSKVLDNGMIINPIEGGTGYGMFGIPGDYTSPSRFIRSFCLSSALNSFESENGINELYSIFRTVFIPKGLERSRKDLTTSDYTRYWSGYDIKNRILYVQTGESLALTTKKLGNNLDTITYTEIKQVF